MAATRQAGASAVAIALGGVLLAALIAITGHLLRRDLSAPAAVVFIAAQVFGLCLGLMARQTPLGKIAAVASGVLLLGGLATVA